MDASSNDDSTRGALPSSTSPRGDDASRPGDGRTVLRVPEYDLLSKIGVGGFGEVWVSRSVITHRTYAVKILSPYEEIELQSLRTVLLAVASHPHLVAINHVGRTTEGRLFIVMPLADNAHDVNPLIDPRDYRAYTLDRHVARAGRLAPKDAAAIGSTLAAALAHMHNMGVAHGDIKPQNVLRFDGQWRLGDYSLVVFPEERARRGGTPGYTPEDDRPLFEADLHMLGVTLLTLIGRSARDLPALLAGEFDALNDDDRMLLDVVRWMCAPHTPGETRTASAAASSLRRVAGVRPPTTPVLAYALAVVLIAAAAALLSGAISRPLFTAWTPANHLWWGWVRSGGTAAVAPALENMNDVVVVAMRDGAPLNELATEAGLVGVDTANLRSLRRLHGELCRRLVGANPAAVVWDIYFSAESEYDADLAAGIGALIDGGVGVVVTSYRWRGETGDAPPVAPLIWNTGARWGSNHVQMDPSGAIWFPLVASLSDGGDLPSLALAAFAASRRPDAWFDVSIDAQRNEAVVRYWRPLGDRPDRRVFVGPDDRVPLTLVQAFEPGPTRGRDPGLRRGDVLGYVHASPAPEASLARATMNYEDVFRMPTDALRRHVRDRVVVIGDFRTSAGDVVNVPGHGPVAGPHIVASAIAQIRANAATHVPPLGAWVSALLASAAITGGGTVFLLGRAHRARARNVGAVGALLVVVFVVIVLIAGVGYRTLGVLVSPFPAMLASLLAATFAAALVASPLWRLATGRNEGVIR